MPLNASGTGPPTVLFAGIHGFAPFADTLRAIGPLFEAPLTAVKLPFDLEAVPSVETLAAPYPARIEARFGTAPCVIAGYSIGCVIAYEVGLRMIEHGRPVRMLLLFDGFAPRRRRRKASLRARASEEESPRYSHTEEEWRAAAVQPLEILRVPNSHIGFFEHPHMADLVQVLNPRLRR